MSYRHPGFVALLAVVLLLPSSSSFAQTCLAPYPGITNWWMGDGSVDDDVGARSAVLNNGAGFADGLVGQAFALDGVDDFVSVAHDPALDLGVDSFAVNFWVNFDDTSGDQVLVEKYVSSGTPSGWSLVKSSSGTLLVIWSGGTYEVTGLSFEPGTWHHIGFSREGTIFVRIFVDGVVTYEGISGDLSSTSSLKFGHRGSPADTPGSTDSSGLYLHGRIDEVLYSVGTHMDNTHAWDVYNAGSDGVCALVPECGNGRLEDSEICDDGNFVSGDGCDNNCSPSRCGNGFVAGSEICDDGNQESGDGCDSNCTPTGCGNGVWSYGETCDDGNLVTADGCESDCSLTPGILDPTFDFDGVALGSEAVDWEPMYVALQADGRIIAAYTAGGAAVSRFAVTRYDTDGTLDTTFGTAGVALTAIGAGDAYVRAMAVQPDDKIVVAGRSDDLTSDRITIARYLADGGLDPTFDGDGIVVTTTAGPGSHVEGVAVAADGHIVITGGNENENLLVARYDSSGALDPAFGGGIVVDPLVTVGTSVVVQPDGRIVTATGGAYEYGDIVVSRFLVDGRIDRNFGVDGRQVFPVGTEWRSEVALQPDGKIVVAGQARATASLGIATLRLNSDGSPDGSYDGDGISVIEPTTGDEIVGGLAIGADSAITVTGLSDHGGYQEITLVRFRADGSPDLGVLGKGSLGTTLGQDSDRGYDVVLQPDGKAVVVAGTTETGQPGLAVLRFLVGTCGDLRAQTADGEQCDDGNASNGDGCESDCTMTPIVQSATAGGSVTTDPLGQGATESSPLQTSLTTPNAGTVSIAPVVAELEPVAGFELVGIALEIEAPPATPQAPLSITLTVDPSALPPGTSADHLEVLRDGVAIDACTGAAGTASPDPCIEERALLVSGDIRITVLTSHASLWAMALRGLLDGEQDCVNAVGKAAAGVAKAQSKLNDACLKAVVKGATADADGCLLADARGKVETANEKLEAASFEHCVPPPPFGFGDVMLAGEDTRDAAIGLVTDLLGPDVDSVAATDKSGAKCQAGVLKSMEKLFATQAKLLLACTEEGLAGGTSMIVSAEDLASCIEAASGDPKAAKGVAKLVKSVASKCGGDSSLLPGACSDAGHVGVCLGHRVTCRLCGAFRAAWGLDADCDEIDNSIPDSSCE